VKWTPTLFIGFALVCLTLACTPPSNNSPVAEIPQPFALMPSDNLESQVENLKPESLATAARLGPSASPLLAHLARQSNPEVRAQALICLRASGGPEAAPTAIAALDDPDATVVANALQVLQTYPPSSDVPLLVAYERYEEPRDQIALIAGRLGSRASVPAWKVKWLAAAPGSALGNALLTAVARMGDPEARREFATRLGNARDYDSPPWIDRAVYQDDPWVIEPLSKLLDRTERATELTPDDPADLRPLRTCDLAANAILRLTRAKPAFPAPRATPYSDAEINEIRRLAMETLSQKPSASTGSRTPGKSP
jgi:HEAT repeats